MNATTAQPPVMALRAKARTAPKMREASWSACGKRSATPLLGMRGLGLDVSAQSQGRSKAVSKATALQDASRLCALLGLCVVLAACGKSEAPKTAAPAAAAKPVVSEAQLDSEISRVLTPEPEKAAVSAADEALKTEADDIISRYPGKTATELLNTPEVKDRLAAAMTKMTADPVLMKRVNSTVELAAQIKGLEGAAKLDLDMKGYDRSRTSRMLQSVLSGQPGRIVDFLISEIGEATPDISYGGLERAPNGVAIVPNTIPAAAAAPPTDPE